MLAKIIIFAAFCAWTSSLPIDKDKDTFLKNCEKQEFFFESFFIDELKDCLVCHDVVISPETTEKSLELTKENCIVFDKGNVGIVNSDFFKLFPNTKIMSFYNVTMDLKSSEIVNEHKHMELLGIVDSTIKNNYQTNAFHSLKGLKKIVMTDNIYDHTSIDGKLLEMNSKIEDLTILDSGIHPPRDEGLNILKNIEEDAFKNLVNLKKVYVIVHSMTFIPGNLLEDKVHLKEIQFDGRFESFPKNLPEDVERLSISHVNFKKLSREDVKKFTKVKGFSMYWGNLEEIDEDTFADMPDLRLLDLNHNKLKTMSSKYFKNYKNLVILAVGDDDNVGGLDFSDLGFEEKRTGFFIRKH